jgi:hypothetical protein
VLKIGLIGTGILVAACGSMAASPAGARAAFAIDAGVAVDAGVVVDAGLLVSTGGAQGGNGGTIAGGQMLGCQGVLYCESNCPPASSCVQACLSQATAAGQELMQDLSSCLATVGCAMTGGGVCDHSSPGFDPTLCTACMVAATGVGGQCASQMQACNNDP